MRTLHRISSIFAALFLLVLAITGIFLNHPKWVSSQDTMLHVVAARPGHPNELWFGTKKGVSVSRDKGKTLIDFPLRYTSGAVADIVFATKDHIYIAFEERLLIESTNGGRTWSRIDLPEHTEYLYDLDISPTTLSLVADSGFFTYTGSTWTQRIDTSEGAHLHYLIRKIHSGYIFAPLLIYAYDISAVILVGLILSGIVLFFRYYKRRF